MKGLRRIEDGIGALLLAGTLIVVIVQVVVRFLLYRWVETAWADEIGRALLVWTCFWGAVLVTREGQHITVDILYERLGLSGQRALRALGDVVMGAFLVLIVWKGFPILHDSLRRPSPATNLPFFIFDGALWVSSVLMIGHVVGNASRHSSRSSAP